VKICVLTLVIERVAELRCGRPWSRILRSLEELLISHSLTNEFEPEAHYPTPGSVDLFFITETPISEVIEHFNSCNVKIVGGPVKRTGATEITTSIYCYDPDHNLIEISN